MISIKVRVFATLRDVVGAREVDFRFPSSVTVRSLIQTLSNDYSHGKLESQVFGKNGEVRKFVKILVNGRDIDFLDGPSTRLNDGDIIAIFPPVGGG